LTGNLPFMAWAKLLPRLTEYGEVRQGVVICPWPANRQALAIQASDLADLIRAGSGKLEKPFQ
jgi:hypothetical protein